VVEALGNLESADVTAYLVTAMKDSDAEVRRAAAEALGQKRERD
jgi:HEAT repeat protein